MLIEVATIASHTITMATIEDPASSPLSTPYIPTGTSSRRASDRAGRHSKFKPVENLIIIQEGAACKPHNAAYGQVRSKFEEVAERCNANQMMPEKVTWNAVQDYYKSLQEWVDKEDVIISKLSGVGGGLPSGK